MIPLTAHEAGAALGLPRLCSDVPGVSTDSRRIRPGDLFVALVGEAYDGHDFVAPALAAGASGAVVLVDRAPLLAAGLSSGSPAPCLYPVSDTVAALGVLARAVRRKSQARVIAVTGSVGKTSTKDLLRSLVAGYGPSVATEGNQNNEIGVPLTLLRLEVDTQVAVVEMGMRGRGQIAALAQIAEPDVGLITNVAPVHLELLGSLEEVGRAKAELLKGLRPGGAGVIPWGSSLLEGEASRAGRRIVRFGFGPGGEAADIWGELRRAAGGRRLYLRWPEGQAELELPWTSRHRYENSVGAAAACWAAGLDLTLSLRDLAETVFTPLRGEEAWIGGTLILNDTYNANPPAMRAALDSLADRAGDVGGRAIAVLGDMLELGPEADRYHREVGIYAAECGVEALWGIGPQSKAMVEGFAAQAGAEADYRHLPSLGDEEIPGTSALTDLMLNLRPRDVVLVKASRGMRLERVVEVLREALVEREAGGVDDRTRG